ncbi:hypothetical protein H5399_15720 [Tessaracoccus sp. MC1627]|uniref:hypothetical protein n=1 Tax=Tessaracoccus sp. MC1627 TaxID=2760312 RepID=UPI0015FF48F7|nr:hypothetical protein [Tessaracoccus sp. MC1627]MBB1514036.1 hypothetical protein [Tessaracoccus sp. MC1627]
MAMATSRPKALTKNFGPKRILLALLEVPAGAAALWLAWTLAAENPLEEPFDNSMVNFVPGALIPYMVYMSIAALGIWLVFDAFSTVYRAFHEVADRRRRRDLHSRYR